MNDVPALVAALRALHRVDARHIRTDHVRDADKGQLFWEGNVEVFQVEHRRAQTAFGWSVATGQGKERVLVVLAIAPLFSALDAVRAAQAVRRQD